MGFESNSDLFVCNRKRNSQDFWRKIFGVFTLLYSYRSVVGDTVGVGSFSTRQKEGLRNFQKNKNTMKHQNTEKITKVKCPFKTASLTFGFSSLMQIKSYIHTPILNSLINRSIWSLGETYFYYEINGGNSDFFVPSDTKACNIFAFSPSNVKKSGRIPNVAGANSIMVNLSKQFYFFFFWGG